MREMNWEQEAKRQAAAAGELKITLAKRLEAVQVMLNRAQKCKERSTSDVEEQVLLDWQIGQLAEQAAWLESTLQRRQEVKRWDT